MVSRPSLSDGTCFVSDPRRSIDFECRHPMVRAHPYRHEVKGRKGGGRHRTISCELLMQDLGLLNIGPCVTLWA